jgi:hypothetical protein
VGQDGAIRGGIGDTGEHKPSFDLIIIQERLVRLVNRTGLHLTSAGGASSCATGVGQVNALLFSRIQDVLIFGNFDSGIQTFSLADQRDLISCHVAFLSMVKTAENVFDCVVQLCN